MKSNFIFFLLLIFAPIFGFSQNTITTSSDTITIEKPYIESLEKPIVLSSFGILKNNTHSPLYIFNTPSYHYFQDLRELLKTESSMELDTVIQSYHDLVLKQQDFYDTLARQCEAQQDLYQKTINELEHSVNRLEVSVNSTANTLQTSNTALEAANSELKLYKKKRFWKNMGGVGAGAVLGVLVGVLVAH